ncbi:hexaprenyl pyrophosphate synthase [Zalerion maritima]|uniref:Hexaprenyl pyrophosphate synthase n=1 Tax=Zalerion maritima TaxID=339359 RepID=A0AAD5RX29_9PEZI|nr:hexaprenyl pyrophosphate synthase [Zalerion maritima]
MTNKPSSRAPYHTTPSLSSSALGAAVAVAQNMVHNAVKDKVIKQLPEPLQLVAKEMKFLTGNLRNLLGSGHPSLDRIAKYYTKSEGKHMRPLIVLLMSRATFACPKSSNSDNITTAAHGRDRGGMMAREREKELGVDQPMSMPSILNDVNPNLLNVGQSPTGSPLTSFAPFPGEGKEDREILPSQRRLAEITELIHTASLLHDDVIDHASARRGSPSANSEFGNKMAVLAGDFLLGRASVALARLRNAEVIELLATVIANLVEGEFMQLKNTAMGEENPGWNKEVLPYYLQKTYLKTASLISKSCRASALLGGADQGTVDAAYLYGKNLGLAFQLVDDMLDWTRSEKELGKPAGADLELGLATAPLLFAWESNSDLGTLVGRRFSEPGDISTAQTIVRQSDGIERTRQLAEDYANQAVMAISDFPDTEAKSALISMAEKTIKRKK